MDLLVRWFGLRCRLRMCGCHIVDTDRESWVQCATCGKRIFRIWPPSPPPPPQEPMNGR